MDEHTALVSFIATVKPAHKIEQVQTPALRQIKDSFLVDFSIKGLEDAFSATFFTSKSKTEFSDKSATSTW